MKPALLPYIAAIAAVLVYWVARRVLRKPFRLHPSGLLALIPAGIAYLAFFALRQPPFAGMSIVPGYFIMALLGLFCLSSVLCEVEPKPTPSIPRHPEPDHDQPKETRLHEIRLKTGIQRTPEFERKGLATHAVNIGTKCGHDCSYCSTGAILRMHPSFKLAGENPFAFGYALVDPTTPARVSRDAKALKDRRLVQLCTTVDAWAPEAQQFGLGRRCLEAILGEPGWMVRILTKNAAVARDFDLIEKHKERVLVGLSLTAPPDKTAAIRSVEPNASTIAERMEVMVKAHRVGLRTYGMYCPLLPGIADSPQAIQELIGFGVSCGVEEVFVEPVNARGPGLKSTEEALRQAGFPREADAIAEIRHKAGWSAYVARLLNDVQAALRRFDALDKLRFLLYPSRLTGKDMEWIRNHGEGVRWLGKEKDHDAVANGSLMGESI